MPDERNQQIGSLSLKVKTESKDAVKGLDKLKETLSKLKSISVGKDLGLKGLRELASSIARLKSASSGIKLSSIASGISKIKDSLAGIGDGTKGISKLIGMLDRLRIATKSLPELASNISVLKDAAVGVGRLGNKLKKSPTSSAMPAGEAVKTVVSKPMQRAVSIEQALPQNSFSQAKETFDRFGGSFKNAIEQATKSISEAKNSFFQTREEIGKLDGALEKNSESFLKTGLQIQASSKMLNKFKEIAGKIPEGAEGSYSNLITAMASGMQELNEKTSPLIPRMKAFSTETKALSVLGTGFNKFVGAVRSGANIVSNSLSYIGSKFSGVSNIISRMGNIAMYRAIRMGLSFVSHGIKEGIDNLYQYSKLVGGPFAGSMDSLATSALKLKNSLGSMFSPLIAALAPTINWIISKISTLFDYINQFVSALSGKSTWLKAKDYSVEYAKSAERASRASIKAGRAATKSAKQVSDAVRKATLGIDELNIIQRKSSAFNNPVGPIGGGGGISAGPDFSGMFQEMPIADEIQKNLERIEALVWASLFAVGLLLFCTGHPLIGLGFMLVGAYKFSEKAEANWGYLQQALQSIMSGPIGTFTAIAGATALLIGFILLGTGVKPDVGLGLVALGAAGMGLLSAANWDYLSEQLKGPLGMFAVVAGATAVLFGSALLFSGARPELGLALIALGLVSIGTVAGANWDWLSEKLKGPLGLFLKISGAVAILFGAALLFSGVASGLGLGLIVLGVSSIVTAVLPDWDFASDKISGILKNIAAMFAAGGAACIAIGVILLCTGVGIPLGISLILMGAAGIVTAVAANWDWIQNTISSIFESVKSVLNNPWVKMGIGVLLCCTGVFAGIGIALIGEAIQGMLAPKSIDKDALKDKVSESTSAMSSEMDKFNKEAKIKTNTAEEIFKKAGENITSKFKSSIENTYKDVKSTIETWSENIKSWFTGGDGNGNIFDKFKSFGGSITSNFGKGISTTYSKVKDAVTTWASSVLSWFTGNGPKSIFAKFGEIGGGVVNSLKSGIEIGMKKAGDFFGNIGNTIAGWFNPVTDKFKVAGENSAKGYAVGFDKKWSEVEEELKRLGPRGFKKFASGIKMSSPSKLYISAGKYSVEGYNIGIKKAIPSSMKIINEWSESLARASSELKIEPNISSLKYDVDDYANKVSAEVNTRANISVSGVKESLENFYKEQILPIVNQMAADLRKQADKPEKTVVQIGGRTIEETVTTQRRANGYNFLG